MGNIEEEEAESLTFSSKLICSFVHLASKARFPIFNAWMNETINVLMLILLPHVSYPTVVVVRWSLNHEGD